jgi:Tfp pilus assembly protein PilF
VSPTDFVSRGQALVAAGQYQEAVKVCRLGLLGRPGALDGRLVLGQALLALRRHDEVLAEMRVALELDPASASGHALRGEALLRKGDPYAAVEALDRARSLAPGDPSIAALAKEGALAIASGGARGAGYGDFGDSMTKHYPSHQGDGKSGPSSSGSFTRPSVAARERPRPTRGGPSPHTGTVEIDPELEGVELDPVDALADPPPPRPHTEDLGDDDVVDDDDVEADPDDVVEVEAAELIAGGDRAQLRGPSYAARDDLDEQTVAERPPSARGRIVHEQDTPPPEPRGTRDRGLDDRAIHDRATPRPEPQPARAPSPARAGRPSERPDPGHRAAAPRAVSPSHALGARPLEPELARSAAAIDALFPDEDPAPAPRPAAARAAPRPTAPPAVEPGPRRSHDDDMRTIRAALGGVADASAPATAKRPESTGVMVNRADTPRPTSRPAGRDATELVGDVKPVRPASVPAPRRGRRALAIAGWIAAGLVVIGGGVVAGGYVRHVRLEQSVTEARDLAIAASRTDTFVGWRRARDLYSNILDVADAPDGRAAAARARAVLAADFGEDPAGGRAAVAALARTGASSDAAIAEAYLAVASGDPTSAATAAEAARQRAGGAIGDYLVGRAALLGGRWAEAATAFEQAEHADPRPATYLGRAAALAAQGQWAAALAACDQALGRDPASPGGVADHPGALILRARIVAARAAALPGAPDRAAAISTALADLDRVAAEAQAPAERQVRGVGPIEDGLAALARAELEHARGDRAAAGRALERAAVAADRDLRIAEGVLAIALALGDDARAAEVGTRAAALWPASPGPRIAAAAAALDGDDPAGALALLGQAGTAAEQPYALALRGRARLATGDLDGAAADLDRALAANPTDPAAATARAEVDLGRGDPRAAAERLAALATAPTAATGTLLTYAAALRATDQRAPARALIDRVLDGKDAPAKGPVATRAWLERARLAADPAAAQAAYARAIQTDKPTAPQIVEARLEAALLAYDAGDAPAARTALDALVADAATDGRALLAAARLHLVLGDAPGAKALLDRAEASPSAPRWQVARERGRAALRGRDAGAAIEALERAVSLAENDGETRLLLIDAHLLGKNELGARKSLDDVLKKFHGRPEANLAAGRVAYYLSHDREAQAAFGAAHDQLVKEHAPPRLVADAAFWLGRVRFDDNPELARKLLTEATTLDPQLGDAYVFLGLIASDKNDPKAAADAFTRAAAVDPDNLDTWFSLGQAAAQAGDPKIARRAYEEYLKRAPKGEYAADARAALKRLR